VIETALVGRQHERAAPYQVGTGIRWLLMTYAPAIDNAIGAGVAQGVDSIRNAINTTLLRPRQFELDSFIDSPIYHSPDYYGDFGVSFPMGTFIDGGGGCGVVADMDPSLIPELCSV
jgi:hypothetical protein